MAVDKQIDFAACLLWPLGVDAARIRVVQSVKETKAGLRFKPPENKAGPASTFGPSLDHRRASRPLAEANRTKARAWPRARPRGRLGFPSARWIPSGPERAVLRVAPGCLHLEAAQGHPSCLAAYPCKPAHRSGHGCGDRVQAIGTRLPHHHAVRLLPFVPSDRR